MRVVTWGLDKVGATLMRAQGILGDSCCDLPGRCVWICGFVVEDRREGASSVETRLDIYLRLKVLDSSKS